MSDACIRLRQQARFALSIGELNRYRLPQSLFGYFFSFLLDGRRPACVSKRKNFSKILLRTVQTVFPAVFNSKYNG